MPATIVDLPAFNGPGYSYSYTQFSQRVTRTRTTIDVRIVAPSSPGDYPIVYWSHGHFSQPYGVGINDPIAIAERGYIVVVPVHLDSLNHPDQGSLLNDRFPVNDPQSTLYRVADINHLNARRTNLVSALNAGTGGGYTADFANPAVAGHSHGAFVSQMLTGVQSATAAFSGLANPDFKLALLVSPQGNQAEPVYGLFDNGPGNNSWQNATTPTLYLVGTEDIYPGTSGISHRDRLDGFERGPGANRFAFLITGADHEEMANGSDPAVTAAVADAAATFLDAYANGAAAARASLLNPEGYVAAHAGVSEAYERGGATIGGALGGAGFVNGGSAAETLLGLSTSDKALGKGGSDTIDGAGGADVLHGGPGRDTMTGGAGNDRFAFSQTSDSGTTSTTRDRILDFDDNGDDVIDLSALDGNVGVGGRQLLSYIGTVRFTAPGQVRAVSSGSSVLIEISNDSDTTAEMVIELSNATLSQITASDFILN